MQYAPVIIPTLNRYEHLKRCIESLQRNSFAKETELYISIDYPPSQKYCEGYYKVVQYVKNEIKGFKKTNLFFQPKNLGPFSNCEFLQTEVAKRYETFIFTEDDNEFSPNFLAYMNEGLNKFRGESHILTICGYCNPIINGIGNELVKSQSLFSCWGYATWIEKWNNCINFSKEEIQIYMRKFSNVIKLCKISKHLFVEAVQIITDKHYLALDQQKRLVTIDCVTALYLIIKNEYVIIPCISKVRNHGYDGSGLHCESIGIEGNMYVKQAIDIKESISENLFSKSEEELKIIDSDYLANWNDYLKAWILWILFKLRILPK